MHQPSRIVPLLLLALTVLPPDAPAQTLPTGIERIEIPVDGMTFDALAAGPEDGELVLMLHGFPQTSYSYRHQIPALAALGFRVVAPDQRGYSPRARPDDVAAYQMPNLVGDVLGMATALGHDRFHLIGHDWGAAVAWVTAASAAPRVRSLVALSTPHVTAFGRALAAADSEQSRASGYFATFRAEGSERAFLADGAARFRTILQQFSMGESDVRAYLEVLGHEDALRAALNWYRASAPSPGQAGGGGAPPALVSVPTMYVWSTADPAFTRSTAEASAEFVVGPYRFEVLEGISHWIPEHAPDRLTELLTEHLERWKGS